MCVRPRALPSLLLVLPLLASSLRSQVVTPLHVVNPTTQTRTLEPVSVGFPVMAQLSLYDVATFVLRDASQQVVPCQFKVLSRWGADRSVSNVPLKWVLATFRTTVPPNATTHFTVSVGTPTSSGGVVSTNSVSAYTITTHTGTSFEVPKAAFGPFSKAVLNGQTVVNTLGSLQFVDATGATLAPVVTQPTIAEESGPVRTVLRQRGTLGTLAYTTRWTFHSGRDDVAVEFRLENPNAYGLFSTTLPDGQAYFDLLSINQPIVGSTLTVTSSLASHTIPAGQTYEMAQDYGTAVAYDALSGFAAVAKVNGAQVGTTDMYPGAFDVTGSVGGATITVERFWQNFPKALRVMGGEARVALFPEFGHGPEYRGQFEDPTSNAPVDPLAMTNYRFEGGRWKTYKMVFEFHGLGARTTSEVAASAVRVNSPLVGYAETSAARRTFATGNLLIERNMPPVWTSILRYNQFYDMMVDDNAATNVAGLGKIGLPGFINRGGTWGDRQVFGWETYGDLPWADGYCDLHYNWPGNLLLEFIRTGDWRFFERGRDMAVFRRDYGQNHSTAATEVWRGCQFYEKGWWHGNSFEGDHGHNWAMSTLLHYVLTGDEGSREAAIENAAFCLRNPPGQWTGWWGSRIPGRAIEALVDAYTFLGDPAYLAAAGAGVARFESYEVADGSLGYHLNPANGTTSVWMDNVFYVAAAKYMLAANDFTHRPFLGRMRNWFKNTCIVYPVGPITASTMPMVYDVWTPQPGSQRTISIHHNWEMIEALSYSAVIHADITDLNTAAMMFEGMTRYWQVGANPFTIYNALNANAFSAITMRPAQYPSTESKVLGGVLNAGNPVIAVQSFVLGYW